MYECWFITNCTRKIVWLLVNNIHSKFGLLSAFRCHRVTPPCSPLQMTTSTKTGLNFDRWILMGKNTLEARNLFTENWSLLSFYIFNFQVIPLPPPKELQLRSSFFVMFCIHSIWVLVEESVATGISAMAVFVSLTAGIIILSFSHKVRWLIRQLCTSFKTVFWL